MRTTIWRWGIQGEESRGSRVEKGKVKSEVGGMEVAFTSSSGGREISLIPARPPLNIAAAVIGSSVRRSKKGRQMCVR